MGRPPLELGIDKAGVSCTNGSTIGRDQSQACDERYGDRGPPSNKELGPDRTVGLAIRNDNDKKWRSHKQHPSESTLVLAEPINGYVNT